MVGRMHCTPLIDKPMTEFFKFELKHIRMMKHVTEI